MSWTEHALLALDTETTGVDVHHDRIVTASLVWHMPGQDPRVREWLINPGIPIPQGATEVHGITTEHAAEHGMDPATALHEIVGTVALAVRRQTPIVVMNASFDLSLLDAEARRHDVAPLSERLDDPVGSVLDPLVIDRALRPLTYPGGKVRWNGRKLHELCDWYGVVQEDAHQSSGDCRTTLRVLLAMAAGFPDLAARDPWEIHEHSIRWHAEWAASFAAYLEAKGKHDHDLDGSWPIRPPRDAVTGLAVEVSA